MRYLFAMLAVVGTMALAATPAAARGHYRHHLTHKFAHYLSGRHFHHTHAQRLRRHYAHRHHYRHAIRREANFPRCFYEAASLGGPCGCWAEWTLLGLVDHMRGGINWWLASDWLRLPHVAPAPGTAAVSRHHVAPVIAGPHPDGTVTVRDSWATHRVRTAGLVFVQPPTRRTLPRLIAWPSSVPL
jgi:hypothetical protein